jgi:hypothetical protein
MPSRYVVLCMLLVAGCSSFRADPERVREIPADRLLAAQVVLQGGGEVVVSRDFGVIGGGCYVALEVDRQVVARIGVGERGHFQVAPGSHVVGIRSDTQDDTLCGKGRLQREVLVQVRSGQPAVLRIVSQNRGGFDIWPVESR